MDMRQEAADLARIIQGNLGARREACGDEDDQALWDRCQRVMDAAVLPPTWKDLVSQEIAGLLELARDEGFLHQALVAALGAHLHGAIDEVLRLREENAKLRGAARRIPWRDPEARRLYENSPAIHADVKTLTAFMRVLRLVEASYQFEAPSRGHGAKEPA